MSVENRIEKSLAGPDILYLNTHDGAMATATAIHDRTAVVHYGATCGTAFIGPNRELVAHLRKETATPPVTVSVVSTLNTAIEWMDRSKIHPLANQAIDNGGLRVFETTSFVLFPTNEHAKQTLSPHCINNEGGVQVFFVSESDQVLQALSSQYGLDHFFVRSSNLEGEPESFNAHTALLYAHKINAPFVLPDKDYVDKENPRQRVMSQPIIELPTVDQETPTIRLRRAGNTSPETMKRLCKIFTDEGINFIYQEVKKSGVQRPEYHSPLEITNPYEIQQDLLRASGL